MSYLLRYGDRFPLQNFTNSLLEVDGIVGLLTWYALMSNMIQD
ncbi:peptidoglycan-binding protein [Okeania sp. SIO3B5]|nr:hypothetical protein [Okeania sp. SIO3B5]